ncbi:MULTISPECIES: DUF3558 domain-containing protein [unclassified Streptomyces]|uniref:DUF3558 domain-containing protein n=1 Tax=unclassified Streptomyces TaxID=2593676 RepID=UPI00081F3BE6|nr:MULTISPECIES: DUF3558 domain-containing protein [unclassified Streptomyces]MYZ35035.1 DUF3558 domain-containing protein [Streptomyces sp. SID4917]SCF72269.1 hypothetical protein GA0115259_101562 [Streptomyces sp. MnatMP-M17]
MHRSASRLTRILACAAVPVMLVVAGCSSGSGGGDADGSSTSPTAQPSATVAPAKFTGLPDACATLGRKTIDSLVPKAKVKGGTAGKSSDITARASCSWNGLDDNGVKGSQYRWLDISLTRYDSDVTLGSGAKRATEYYTKEVAGAKGTEGAKELKATPSSGIGSEATTVTYSLKKTDEDFSYATVVARTENVVVTLTYNGAGYAGAKSPSIADMSKDAVKAAKETVAAVSAGSGQTPATGESSAQESAKAE